MFVLVLDDLNTSFTRTARVKLAAKEFIERYLGANDVAAIVQTGGAKATGQEFTGSRERLLRAVNNFMGQKERSATLGRIDEYYRTLGTGATGRPRDPNEEIRVYKARNTYTVLKNVADYMAGIRGRRKAVVFFSEGVDYDIYDPIANTYATDIRQYSQDAIAAATRANVSFYGVDPRGLSAFDDAAEIASIPNDPSLNLGLMALQRELQTSQDSLRVLSDETGGFAAVNSNDFAKGFERIIRDNSSYYVLGYYSDDSKRDGQFRPLTVRVKRPGLEVRARKGYNAAKGRPPAGTPAPAGIAASIAMREALDSPVPITGLGMRAFAAPMMGAKPKASVLVVVELEGQAIKFKQDGPLFVNNVEVAILAMDEGGKVRDGAKDMAELKLRPDTHALVAEERRASHAPPRTPARQLPAPHRRARKHRRACRFGDVRPRGAGLQQDGPHDGWHPARRGISRSHPDGESRSRLQGHSARVADRRPGVPLRRSVDAGRRRLRQQGRDAPQGRDSHQHDRRRRGRRVQRDRRAPHRGVEGRERHLRARRDDSAQRRRARTLRPARRSQVHAVERRHRRARDRVARSMRAR